MLRKVIDYTDFDGNKQQDVCYFNLTKSEVFEMEVTTEGGMSKMFETLAESKDGATIVSVIKKLILGSYGEKSPDGKRFIKSKELADAFFNSAAYDTLFMELLDPKALEDFLFGVLPLDGMTREQVRAQAANLLAEGNK